MSATRTRTAWIVGLVGALLLLVALTLLVAQPFATTTADQMLAQATQMQQVAATANAATDTPPTRAYVEAWVLERDIAPGEQVALDDVVLTLIEAQDAPADILPPTRTVLENGNAAALGALNAGEVLRADQVAVTQFPSTEAAPVVAPTPTPFTVAVVPVRLVDAGEVIGSGTVRLFSSPRVQAPSSFGVELSVTLDERFVPPGDTADAGDVPLPSPIAPPARPTLLPFPTLDTALATLSPGLATPRTLLAEERLPALFERMGAELICPQAAFSGCGPQSPERVVGQPSTTFFWAVTPLQAASAAHTLRAELTIVRETTPGRLDFTRLWGHTFVVEVLGVVAPPPSDLSGVLWPAIIGGLAAATAIGGGWWLARRRRATAPAPTPARRPSVFLSYRRGTSWSLARSVAIDLERRGARVFLDVDDINEGRFADIIARAIAGSDYFVPILAPGTLDSAWVRREIAIASEQNKVIVPLLADGFRLSSGSLPDDVAELASHNAITVVPEFFDAATDRLATRFLKLGAPVADAQTAAAALPVEPPSREPGPPPAPPTEPRA